MAEVNAISALLSDFAGRVKALEEKFNLLRERVLVLTQNFVSRERDLQKELDMIQDENKNLRLEMRKLSERFESMVSRQEDYARKEELAVVEKYFKLFEPIKFVTSEEIEERVERILKERKHKD
ncbi:MAG TPA: hypothetical protein HA282_05540 [Nanoarchaeota archaeon]|nr:MAG: hypothetical protein QT01_C0001G0121 [archaeon GW2011_AR6]MBS3082548.1 hypothetical protein [Candidatus Pacearchaeota archaeon]HIH17491.1 hypothetical protein [Nanoarchaeota archaeon]HIH33926.1 hypothetical protein [Nanoarchaeota archaeon]HIH51783.1 hypothetical protein [Nanoarchaeota archaeon]